MAGGVEEGDLRLLALLLRVRDGDGVGADVLGDAAGFAGGDVGLADDVEERGFTMVHVAHDGDDGRTGLEVLGFVVDRIGFDFLGRGVDVAFALGAFLDLELEAVLGAELDGDGLVHRLVDVGENAHLHQVCNELEGLPAHLFREVADDDGRLHHDDLRAGGE